MAKALGCLYYYSITEEKNAAIKKWLKDRRFIAATRALGIRGDYL
jgi:hypothetical protein